jgi:hypothetical protein
MSGTCGVLSGSRTEFGDGRLVEQAEPDEVEFMPRTTRTASRTDRPNRTIDRILDRLALGDDTILDCE